MGLAGGMKCIQFLVFSFNFIFWLCGIALIGLGIWVKNDLYTTLGRTGTSPSMAPFILILVLGVIVFFISFFGCCGAWKENHCMITTFAVLLTLILLVEIAAVIVGYIFKNQIVAEIDNELLAEMKRYKNDTAAKDMIDRIQANGMCCGFQNYTDWFNIPDFEPHSVPDSCCKNNGTDCPTNPTKNNVYEEGCVMKNEMWLKKHAKIVAAVALAVAFFEILGIIFACCLMKGIRSGYEVM